METPPPDEGPGNYRQRQYFDGLGRTYKTARKSHVVGGAIWAETAFNARGSIASQTAPYYNGDPVYTTTHFYDAMDRRIETLFPDDNTTSTSYGLWEETRTDPKGHEDVWTYDAQGRVVSKEPEAHLTPFQYDLLGNRVGMTDAEDNDWSWEYDSLGRMIEQDDPDSGLTTFQYDSAGRLRFKTDAKSQQTELVYSPTTGRLSTKSNAAGTVQHSYSEPRSGYFNVGQLTTVTDPASIQRLDYDALGRGVRAQRVLDGVTYTASRIFDSGGRLRSIEYPDTDSISNLAYDAANRLKDIPGVFTNATYDASDRPLSRPNANGTSTTWSYNPERGWLESIVTNGPFGTVQNFAYSHDDDGLVEGVTSPFADEGWTYDYDPWHRLNSATSHTTPPNSQSFQYDDVGRITYNSLVGSYVYQNPVHAHAPSSIAGQSYTYDANGNLLAGGGRTLVWNADNLPSQVTLGGNSTAFTYDGTGSRVKKVAGATTTRYPFADELEITNGEITKYINAPGMGVVAKRVGGSFIPYWLHTDKLGSIQAVTNASGAVVQRRTYRPYGDTIADTTGHAESRGYIDQRQDPETGLTYLHARYYDSRLGVFLSPDPLGPDGGPNLYGYSRGNPVNATDRSGLKDSLCGHPLFGDGCDGGGGWRGWDVFVLNPQAGQSAFNFSPGSGNRALDELGRTEERVRNMHATPPDEPTNTGDRNTRETSNSPQGGTGSGSCSGVQKCGGGGSAGPGFNDPPNDTGPDDPDGTDLGRYDLTLSPGTTENVFGGALGYFVSLASPPGWVTLAIGFEGQFFAGYALGNYRLSWDPHYRPPSPQDTTCGYCSIQ